VPPYDEFPAEFLSEDVLTLDYTLFPELAVTDCRRLPFTHQHTPVIQGRSIRHDIQKINEGFPYLPVPGKKERKGA
jgi:hypothetical protein